MDPFEVKNTRLYSVQERTQDTAQTMSYDKDEAVKKEAHYRCAHDWEILCLAAEIRNNALRFGAVKAWVREQEKRLEEQRKQVGI